MRTVSLIENNPILAAVIKLLAATSAELRASESDLPYVEQFFRFNYPPALADDLRDTYKQYREKKEPDPIDRICQSLTFPAMGTQLFLVFKVHEFARSFGTPAGKSIHFAERVGKALDLSQPDLSAVLGLCNAEGVLEQLPVRVSELVGYFSIGRDVPPADVLLPGAAAPVEIIKLGPDFHVRAKDGSARVGSRGGSLPPGFLVRLDACEVLRIGSQKIAHGDLTFLWLTGAAPASDKSFHLAASGDGLTLHQMEPPGSSGSVRVNRRGFNVHFGPSGAGFLTRNGAPSAGSFDAGVFDEVQISGKKIDLRSLLVEMEALQDQALQSAASGALEPFSFGARAITYRIAAKTIVDSITIQAYRGELTAVMGPSGCGKSTFLDLLRGDPLPQTGDVLLDGIPLRDSIESARLIGFVPQDDLFYESLTVSENLSFSARLRTPGATGAEIEETVDRVLQQTKLTDRRDALVGEVLSGGQRKRLNIGLELLSETPILLLDEPTSGLESGAAEKIIRLLRARCDSGSMIFVVIHQPSPEILAMFDKLILLDEGGKLAFFGRPGSAFDYMERALSLDPGERSSGAIPDPDRLLEMLAAPLKNLDGSALQKRQFGPASWQKLFRAAQKKDFPQPVVQGDSGARGASTSGDRGSSRVRGFWVRQGVTLLRRELLNRLRDHATLVGSAGMAAILAVTIGFIVRDDSSNPGKYNLPGNNAFAAFPFLTVIVAIFLGLAISINEIIRDRATLKRESALRVSASLYLGSKFLVATIYLVPLLALYLGISFVLLEVRELYWHYLAYLTLTGLTGVALGFMVSAIPGINEKTATSLLPVLLIPQIVLAGSGVLPFEHMRHLRIGSNLRDAKRGDIPPEIARFVPSSWALEGVVVVHTLRSRWTEVEKAATDESEAGKQLEILKSSGGSGPAVSRATARHQELGDNKIRLATDLERYHAKLPGVHSPATPPAGPSEFLTARTRLPWSSGTVATDVYNVFVLLLFVAVFLGIARLLLSYEAIRRRIRPFASRPTA